MESNPPTSSREKRVRLIWKLMLVVVILALLTLYVLNASIPGRAAEGCPEGCATAAERVAGGLRVLSLNMLHGFPNFNDLPLRMNLIAEEIHRLDADVVLLQEVPWTIRTGNVAEFLARQLGYNYLYYRANGNKNLIFFEQGEAILSRYSLRGSGFTELKPRASFFDSRVALGATAETPWGEVGLFVTHLTNEDLQVAGTQAGILRQFVEAHTAGSAVVAGDFNSPESSPQIIVLEQAWIDTYRAIHSADAGFTCCIDDLHSRGATPMNERIDYIFLVHQSGEAWKIINSMKVFDHAFAINGGWQWASDHEGLMVEIEP